MFSYIWSHGNSAWVIFEVKSVILVNFQGFNFRNLGHTRCLQVDRLTFGATYFVALFRATLLSKLN